MKKRVLSFALVLCMVLTLLPKSVFASTVIKSGTCGDNLTWVLDGDGTLTISGTGDMDNYGYDEGEVAEIPWTNYKDAIVKITVSEGVTSIGNRAFFDCGNLVSIIIPNSVCSIGDAAFRQCSNLKQANIPSGITRINNYTFFECSSLISVSIPNSVTSIGYCSFYGCINLNRVEIPSGVKSIEYAAFYRCASLESVSLPNDMENIEPAAFSFTPWVDSLGIMAISNGSLLRYTGDESSVTIPNGVTLIAGGAFENRKSLEHVTIPYGVTHICEEAFHYCYNLKTVNIPESVISIGWGAFCDCRNLTDISLPNGVLEIGRSAFSGCFELTSIFIPESVKNIEEYAFNHCSSLSRIDVSEANEHYSSVDGVLLNKDKTLLIQYPIGKADESYSIPSDVMHIGSDAFAHCSRLSDIELPENLVQIGREAFVGCSGILSMTIPNSVKSVGIYAFSVCNSIESVIIGNGVTNIGYGAFDRCSKLKEVFFVGTEEQWNAIAIDEMNDNLLNAKIVFNYDPNHVHSYTEVITYPTCTEKGYTTHICICGDGYVDTYTNALGHAFVGGKCLRCGEIEVIASGICGENLTWILDSEGTLSISGTGKMNQYSNSDTMNNYAPWYDRRADVKKVVFEGDATNISNCAFDECRNLSEILIPATITSIGVNAFYKCSSLVEVDIPSSVVNIGGWAFGYCSNLKHVNLEKGLQRIENCAFYGCSKLDNVNIPVSVTHIGDHAFCECDSLSYINIPDGITEIANSTFYRCSNLKSISIPDSVRSIGEWAFYNCTKLEEIILPSKLDYIDADAFYGCSGISSIEIPDSVSFIGSAAFCACTALEKVQFGKGITSIDSYMLSNCGSINCVIIPKNVTTINAKAFYRDEISNIAYEGSEVEWAQAFVDGELFAIGYVHYNCITLDNHWKETTINPTCSCRGCSFYCCDCGYSYEEEYVNALGHDYGNWTLTTAPTCTVKGEETRYCSRCEAFETREVKALEHDIVHHNARAATCTEIGWNAYDTCSRCNYTTYVEIPALGHDWQAPVFTWAADNSCTAKFVCSRGDATENLNCAVTYKTTDATCTVAGTTVYTATVTFNGKTYTDTKTVVGEIAPHSYGAPVFKWDGYTCKAEFSCTKCTHKKTVECTVTNAVTKAATCKETGVRTYTASAVFGGVTYTDTKTQTIEKAAHTPAAAVHENENPASCTEKGSYDEVVYCSVCKAELSRVSKEIALKAHEYAGGKCVHCGTDDPSYVIENPFTDVVQGSAYYDAVLWGNSKGIVSGFTATEFRPNNTCTRAQVVTFLWRAAESPEPTSTNNPFSDVSAKQANGKDNPFYKAILWGVENGITSGYSDGTFRPNATVTRAQFVTFLWRYEGQPSSSTTLTFNDTSTIAKGYRAAVAWGVENGVIAGYGDNTFRPNATCTRWQVVLFMWRDMKDK